MKVYLDDERPTPTGWIAVRWPDEAIRLLQSGEVTELSLDHDLGDDSRGTGYTVLLWIEEAVALHRFRPPRIVIHTSNASARQKMLLGVRSIERLAARDNAGGLEIDALPPRHGDAGARQTK
ncbi:MAG: cyclic-phosphate processing receiver domain-containing protein [Aureliella sp.]